MPLLFSPRKLFLSLLLLLGTLALAHPASAQTTWPAPTLQSTPQKSSGQPLSALKGGGPFGMGFVVGTTNGLSIKIWPARAHGIVINVGGATLLNSLSAELGYRLHFPPIGDDVTLQVTLGLSARLRLAKSGDALYTEIGGGLPLGVSVCKSGVPAELFAEVTPMGIYYMVGDGTGGGFDVAGTGGVRLYF